MSKKKKQAVKDFSEYQSMHFLVDEVTNIYIGLELTQNDGEIITLTPEKISMEDAEKLIDEFEEYVNKWGEPGEQPEPPKTKPFIDLTQLESIEINYNKAGKYEGVHLAYNDGENFILTEEKDNLTESDAKAIDIQFQSLNTVKIIDAIELLEDKLRAIYNYFDKIESIEYIKNVKKKNVIPHIDIFFKTVDMSIIHLPLYCEEDDAATIINDFNAYKENCTPEQGPEHTPEPEQKEINYSKNKEYTHQLTPEELVKIADEQNHLIEENNQLEAEKSSYDKKMKTLIDDNDARINTLHTQYKEKIVTKTETITPIIDWDKGTMTYLHPETKAVLEELPIPLELRQQSLGFDKSKKKWVINNDFNRDNLSPLQEGIYHLLFAGYEEKDLLELFADKMPATAANIRPHIQERFKGHPGTGGPARNGKPRYQFDADPKGLTLRYDIGDDENKIIKGKELCAEAAFILNQMIIQSETGLVKSNSNDLTTKDFYFEHWKLYQGVEFPKGVTPARIDKVKDVIINSDFFDELINTAKKDGTREHQNDCAKNFFDYCYDVLKDKGIIKA